MKQKIPLKIIFLFAGAALLLVMAITLFSKMYINHRFVKAYDLEEYLTENEEKLLFINTPESYLPYYNMGSVAFENRDYNSAVGYFTKALSLFPLGQKECDVRINLALSICYSIDFQHLESQERVDTALLLLYKARDILLENGWANEDPELARDADAQKLKEDIDEMIKKLENPQGGDDNQNDSDEENDNQDQGDQGQSSQPSDREKKQQDQLDENKKNAMEERKREQKAYESYGDGEDGGSIDGEGTGGSYKPW